MEPEIARRIEGDVLAYARVKSTYTDFAGYIAHIVRECCDAAIIHTVQYRSKELNSFERKCKKQYKDGRYKGMPVYKEPLKEITDFAGVMIIVFVKEYVDVVLNQLDSVLEFASPPEDVGERVYSQKGFGYQSKHVLVRLSDARRDLKGNEKYKGLVCEIQVRTILQHAWAEIEHDIQYKSEEEIPLSLRKRFSALAGLLEIGDNEFQAIEHEGRSLQDTIKRETIDELTQQELQYNRSPITQNAAELGGGSAVAVRDLVNQGKYSEAVDLFTQKIAEQPSSLTLYVGRARLKFLLGDVAAALQDLDAADELSGSDASHTSRLREIIRNGDAPQLALEPFARTAQHAEGQRRAREALAEGDGTKALDEYVALEKHRWNRALSVYGKALACAMEADTKQARAYLSLLEIRPATIMGINISALICVLDIIEKGDFEESLLSLKERLLYTPEFTLEASPLRWFFIGVERRGETYWEKVRAVRDAIVQRAL